MTKYITNLSKKGCTSSLSLLAISNIVKNSVEDSVFVIKKQAKLLKDPYIRTKDNKIEVFVHLAFKKNENKKDIISELKQEILESLISFTELENYKIYILEK